MTSCLGIMARAPVKGEVKSRLAAELGEARALEVYQQLLYGLAARMVGLHLPVFLFGTGSGLEGLRGLAARSGFVFREQRGDSLGERMHDAFASMHAHCDRVILIGCDCVLLEAAHIRAADEALATADVVIAPAEDGGYVLIGSSAPQLWTRTSPFAEAGLGTPYALAGTLRGLQQAGATITMLEGCWDVDTAADLARARHLGLLP